MATDFNGQIDGAQNQLHFDGRQFLRAVGCHPFGAVEMLDCCAHGILKAKLCDAFFSVFHLQQFKDNVVKMQRHQWDVNVLAELFRVEAFDCEGRRNAKVLFRQETRIFVGINEDVLHPTVRICSN